MPILEQAPKKDQYNNLVHEVEQYLDKHFPVSTSNHIEFMANGFVEYAEAEPSNPGYQVEGRLIEVGHFAHQGLGNLDYPLGHIPTQLAVVEAMETKLIEKEARSERILCLPEKLDILKDAVLSKLHYKMTFYFPTVLSENPYIPEKRFVDLSERVTPLPFAEVPQSSFEMVQEGLPEILGGIEQARLLGQYASELRELQQLSK